MVAVLTADDLGLPAHHACSCSTRRVPRPPLARDVARFVGDPVAVVVAETPAAAERRRRAVVVDYEPLAAVVDMEAALAPDAPLHLRRGARQPGRRPARARRPRPPGRRRRGGAGPVREPADRRRADGGQRDRASCPATTAPATSSRSTSRRRCPTGWPGRLASRLRSIPTGDPCHRPARRRRLRRQGRPAGRAHRRHRRRPPARPAGHVDRDPLGEPRGHAPRAGPGAVRRDGLHARTARSSACGAASSATPAPTPGSAAPW